MTLQDLITRVAERSGESKKTVDNVLRGLAHEAASALKYEDGEIPLPGLGKLKATVKAARRGINPATGEEIDIPARNSAKFVVAKALKDALA